jgi:DNA-binding HxlR family transcriptional regulator
MNSEREGRFAYSGLSRIFHEKARLSIMTSLYINTKGVGFNELKKMCELTDGNLSRHLDKLAEAGLVRLHKGFEGSYPKTRCTLTKTGRDGFRKYLAELERIVKDAKLAAENGNSGNSVGTFGLAAE